jgi:hypothetical protein
MSEFMMLWMFVSIVVDTNSRGMPEIGRGMFGAAG